MSNIDKQAVTAKTKELASFMVERFSMNPVSCKLLNEAWEKEFPDEVAIAERMLALLDELEHYKSREERVTKLVLDNSTSWDALYKKLEAAEKRIAEHNFENRLLANADRDIKALRQRIAELESNEIREDGNQFLVVRHPGKTPVIKHWSGDPEEFLRNLIEQDPLVTIDIITHRYYGVGGQWVQDADEYLHMMAAAGIGKGD